jgi:hypothetical protein
VSKCPGIDVLIPQGAPIPHYDVYAPLLTIPGLVGTSLARIPNRVPYLNPDSGLVEKWRKELSGFEGFKVGINWQGNAKYACDFHRSIPLKFFDPLGRIPGVKLFSLQKADRHDHDPRDQNRADQRSAGTPAVLCPE